MNLTTRLARKTTVAAVIALALVAAPRVASAQGVAATQAESLFNQGKALIEQKKYHEACDKFSASLKLDETPNTHLALARCFQLDERFASSWGEYLVVAKKSPDEATRKYAQDQAREVEKKMLKVHLTMALIPDDLTIKIDNESIPKETVNSDLPLDPGDHVIEAVATGKRKWERHVKLAADNSPMAVTISLEDMSPEELKAQQNQGKQVIIERGPGTEPKTEWTGVKTAGLVIGTVGVVSGLAAVTFGILTLVEDSNRSTKSTACTNDENATPKPPPGTQPQSCIDAANFRDEALTFQSVAIATGIGAGVLITTGLVMFLAGGNKKVEAGPPAATWQLTPVISPTTTGMGVVGTF